MANSGGGNKKREVAPGQAGQRRWFFRAAGAGAVVAAVWGVLLLWPAGPGAVPGVWAVGPRAETGAAAGPERMPAGRPNVVILYADDVGYGDLSCYGATKVKTPNLDGLAEQGLVFSDGHCAAATCTPSRYALLTGQYAWRRKGTGVLPGDASLIIEPGRVTLPAVMQKAGYRTACVGKWHLGLGAGGVDWNGEIKPGPLEVGFDHCFIIPATGDRVPCVYVEDHRVAGLDPNDPIKVSYDRAVGDEPTGRDHPELLKVKLSHGHDNTIVNGISRIGYMSGGKAARWVDEDMADVLTRQAVRFIEQNKDRPFFLYFATHDIHVPRVPQERFKGSSQCGVRGDAIVQMDWCMGEVLGTLDRLGLRENTLVIFSSDNGPVVNDGYADGAAESLNGHRPAGALRGGKYSVFEGGTRVPLIVRWPEHVRGGQSGALVSQVDFLASMAALAGVALPAEASPDGMDVLRALLGESKVGRESLVEQGWVLALRQGPWKMIEAGTGPRVMEDVNIKTGESRQAQLYNLADDLGETRNLAAERPGKVAELAGWLAQLRQAGRSQPGGALGP